MSLSREYAGVLFDLDDTLLDHRGAARDALRSWLADEGVVGTLDDWDARWLELETKHYRRYQARETTREGQRRARVREFLVGRDLGSDRAADEAFAAYWALYKAAWRPFPDAVDAVRRARAAGLVVGILTNGMLVDQRRKAEVTGLGWLDVPVIASSELPAAKPSPLAFHTACAQLGVEPAHCLMVGDSVENDVAGASRAGLGAVLVDRLDRHMGVSHRRVRSLAELSF